MKANSETMPVAFIKSKGKTFFNFNIVESQKTDEAGTRTVFNYEYIEVENKNRDSLIRAIMRDKYTVDDEIALLNNKFRGKAKDITDYDDYQAFRIKAKKEIGEKNGLV
jgi:hypothetical protein